MISTKYATGNRTTPILSSSIRPGAAGVQHQDTILKNIPVFSATADSYSAQSP